MQSKTCTHSDPLARWISVGHRKLLDATAALRADAAVKVAQVNNPKTVLIALW
jgi:hypothetical protein